jgi:acyl-CoA synthetase (AMP-forming)/AMP-acid ligase II
MGEETGRGQGGRARVERLFAPLTASAGKPALLFAGRAWTYGDLDRLSRSYARGLSSAGLRPGDRVAVYAETSPEVIVALLAHYRAGLVHVPINPGYRGEELTHILEDSGAAAVLVRAGSAAAGVLNAIEPPENLHLQVLIGGSGGAAGTLAFEWLARDQSHHSAGDRPPRSADDDTAALVYTSGTTGKSKGVELSFRAIVENTEAVTRLWRFTPEDRIVLALPLFHVHGLCLGAHGALLHGQTLLLEQRFEPASVAGLFAASGATVFMGVPTMYVRLLEHMAEAPEAAASLARGRLFTAGSAALPADDFAAFERRTGHRVLERYGMTETLFTISNPYDDRRPGTAGLPVPGCVVRIVGEEGREVAAGEPGQILVRSNGMMSGYRGKPEETAASLRGGWFATGDVARAGPGGYVSIEGRDSVDIIKSGGFKISAREIEDVLRRHPVVKDVAVVGVPDRVWGQRIVAVVVLADPAGAPSEAWLLSDLSSFCARYLADSKCPRAVRVLSELPRNTLGKVQKHRILEEIG